MAIRAMDYPGGRRSHMQAIPRLGGIAIAAGIAAGAILPNLFLWGHWGEKVTPMDMAALLGGTTLVFLVGVADDALGLTPIQKIVVQVLAASVVVYAGWSFSNLYLPFWGNVRLGFFGAWSRWRGSLGLPMPSIYSTDWTDWPAAWPPSLQAACSFLPAFRPTF